MKLFRNVVKHFIVFVSLNLTVYASTIDFSGIGVNEVSDYNITVDGVTATFTTDTDKTFKINGSFAFGYHTDMMEGYENSFINIAFSKPVNLESLVLSITSQPNSTKVELIPTGDSNNSIEINTSTPIYYATLEPNLTNITNLKITGDSTILPYSWINNLVFTQSPVVTSTPKTSVDEYALYNYTLEGDDYDKDMLSWNLKENTTLPSWLSLNKKESWKKLDGNVTNTEWLVLYELLYDSNNIPYALYSDADNTQKLSVKYFNGSTWEFLGSENFTSTEARDAALAFNSYGAPYVSFKTNVEDANNGISVMRHDGEGWVFVGDQNFSQQNIPNYVEETDIAFNSADEPYVAFIDANDSYEAITVMRYIDSAWENVGTPRFNAQNSYNPKIVFDNNKTTPYVAYISSGKPVVVKFDGTSWVSVGELNASVDSADYLDMQMDNNNTLYVSYKDYATDFTNGISVMKYDGTSWVQVGERRFSEGAADHTQIRFDSTNTPYVIYYDYAYDRKATVMKYDGSSWVNVANAGFTDGQVSYPKLAIDSSDNMMVAFNDSTISSNITAMQFQNTYSLQGRPTNNDVGESNISLVLSDGIHTINHDFTLRVNNINNAPTVTSTPVTIIAPGADYKYVLDVNDSENNYVSWAFENNTSLPSWLSFDTNNTWVTLGEEHFSLVAQGQKVSIAFDNNKTQYVAFTDPSLSSGGSSGAIGLKKYVNDTWEDFNISTLCEGSCINPQIAIDNNNTLYMAFSDESYLTVKKYVDGAWELVGSRMFTTHTAIPYGLDFDSKNTPYVHYTDNYNLGHDWGVLISSFDGTNWNSVGTLPDYTLSDAGNQQMLFDSEDNIYVLFNDSTNNYESTVIKYDGLEWKLLGRITNIETNQKHAIALDTNNEVYVVTASTDVILHKFVDNEWVKTDIKKIFDANAYYVDLAIDTQNNKYITYQTSKQKLVVLKYDEQNVQTISEQTAIDIGNPMIHFDKERTPVMTFVQNSVGEYDLSYVNVKELHSTSYFSGIAGAIDIGTYDINMSVNDGLEFTMHNFTIEVTEISSSDEENTTDNNETTTDENDNSSTDNSTDDSNSETDNETDSNTDNTATDNNTGTTPPPPSDEYKTDFTDLQEKDTGITSPSHTDTHGTDNLDGTKTFTQEFDDNGTTKDTKVTVDENLTHTTTTTAESTDTEVTRTDNKKLKSQVNNNGTVENSIKDENGNEKGKVDVAVVGADVNITSDKIVTTYEKDENTTIEANLDINGTASHKVKSGSDTSSADSTFENSNVRIENDKVSTIAGSVASSTSGYVIKAVAVTTGNGKTITRFIKVSETNTSDYTVVGNTVKESTPFEKGNEVDLGTLDNGKMYIMTITPLTDNLEVE